MPAEQRVDVCIIGAGPGGATTALKLSKELPEKYSVLVLDQAEFPRDKVCGDALSGKVMNALRRVAPELLPELQGHTAQVPSWGVEFIAPNGKSLKVPFTRETGVGQAPGAIMKRIDFDALLFDAIDRGRIQVKSGTKVLKTETNEAGIWLNTQDGKRIHARLVIAADGANSRFARNHAGLHLEPKHHCAGVRAYFTGVNGLDSNGFIELHFLKELLPGYFWIFPLPNGAANVGLGIRSDALRKKRFDLKARLMQLIQEHPSLRERFRDARLEGKVEGLGLPLGSKQRRISGNHYLLVGDAGHLIDPFTGEGIGHAMISGRKAAETAVEALAANDLSAEFLSRYDQSVYKRLGQELNISTRLQSLSQKPWLFNFVVNKAANNPALADTISCMFNDLDLRERLKSPGFYWELLTGRTMA